MSRPCIWMLLLLLASVPAWADVPTTQAMRMQDAVGQQIDITLDGQTPRTFIRTLQDTKRLNIFVDWGAFEAAGVDLNQSLSGRLTNVRIEVALNYVFSSICGNVHYYLTLKDNVLWITTRPATEMRIYDISRQLTALAKGQEAVGGKPDVASVIDQIIKVLDTTVDAESWRDAGGTIGSISVVGSTRLCITQTAENHAAIQKVLEKLEKGDGK